MSRVTKSWASVACVVALATLIISSVAPAAPVAQADAATQAKQGGLFGNFKKKLKERQAASAKQKDMAASADASEKASADASMTAPADASITASADASMKMTADMKMDADPSMADAAMRDGSPTRGGPPSSQRTIPTYQRPETTQVDPELAAEVAAAAAEIDRLVMKNLKAEKIKPNPLTNDMQFVRRIYLDITGTIPTGRQTADFLRKSRSSTKRAELIDELLNSSGYVSHSFNYWADVLRLKDNPGNDNYGLPYVEWIKDVLASDMPYDEFVYRLLSAEGRVWENPAAGYALRDVGMPLANLDNTVRIFLGTRIGCAQCHDHPFDRWTQQEFYHLAAFVSGTRTSANRGEINAAIAPARKEMKANEENEENARDRARVRRLIRFNEFAVGENPSDRLRLPHDYQYDDAKPGDVMEPLVIFGQQPSLSPGTSRRAAFATWLTSPENPRFTLTIANRLWERAFGVGVIDPVDDLMDDSEPSNPELMDFLISEMQRVRYQQREFLRIIYNTKTYQREAYRRDLVADEPYHFPGPVLRRMTAEQIWDSLLTLTLADPERYQRPRSESIVEIAAINPGQSLSYADLLEMTTARDNEYRQGKDMQMRKQNTHKGVLLVRASEMPQPVSPSHFLRQYGQSDREIISGGDTEGHVPQVLTMFNGPISHKLLNKGTVIYDDVVSAADRRDQIDVIFMSILSRKPTRTDRRLAEAEVQSNGAAGFGNVIWALLNTREFLFIQ